MSKKIVLWMALLVLCGALAGCSSWGTPTNTADQERAQDPYAIAEPEGNETPPDSFGLFVFKATGKVADVTNASLNFFGNITLRAADGKIGLGTNPGGTLVIGTEAYTILGGGGGLNISEKTINYSLNAQDPTGKPGIARFRGTIPNLAIGDRWVDGTFDVTITQAEYAEGDVKTPIVYSSASIKLNSTARTGTMSISGNGTGFDPGHGPISNISVNLTGNVKSFPTTSVETMHEGELLFQATGGTLLIGANTYTNVNGNAEIDLMRGGQFHYIGNFKEADGTPGIYVINGTVQGLSLDPTGKISGTLPGDFQRP